MAMAMDYSGHVDSTYLDMAAQILSAAKRRTYELMGLQVGHRVLEHRRVATRSIGTKRTRALRSMPGLGIRLIVDHA